MESIASKGFAKRTRNKRKKKIISNYISGGGGGGGGGGWERVFSLVMI